MRMTPFDDNDQPDASLRLCIACHAGRRGAMATAAIDRVAAVMEEALRLGMDVTPSWVWEHAVTVVVTLVVTAIMISLSKLFGADSNDDEGEEGPIKEDKVRQGGREGAAPACPSTYLLLKPRRLRGAY